MFHLVCVQPFGKYGKGQMVTDPDEVLSLLDDREHHFVKIAAPLPEPEPDAAKKPSVAETPAKK